MKKIVKLLLLIFLGTTDVFAQVIRSTTFDNREICEKEGGVWRQFGNGCVDSCKAKLDRFTVCSMALTYGCDCGKERCLDDNKCVKISDYKEIFDKEQKAEKEKQEKQKEARKDQYRNVRNYMLSDLSKTKDLENNKSNEQGFFKKDNQVKTESNNNLEQFKNNNLNNSSSSPIINVLTKPVLEKNDKNLDADSTTPVQQKFQIPSLFLKNNNDDVKKDDSKSSNKLTEDNTSSEEALPKVPLPK
jgi:hypothetical protein